MGVQFPSFPAVVIRKLDAYPNLQAMMKGCVSGRWTEWPAMRMELAKFIESMKFTKRDYEMFDRLGTRAQILRNRLAASQLKDNGDILQELHALEWAIKRLQP